LAFSERPLAELLEDFARPGGAPAAGSACGVVAALAAALAAMAAPTDEGRARAQELGERALALAEEDVRAVGELLEGDAAERAVDVPLAIAETAAEIAALVEAKPGLEGDAEAAVRFAAAAAAAAARLVELNLAAAGRETDERGARARLVSTSASELGRQ
jgi:formiminotetrahydrofolate cyclodeaminase